MIAVLVFLIFLASGGVAVALGLGWLLHLIVVVWILSISTISRKLTFPVRYLINAAALIILLIVTSLGRDEFGLDSNALVIIAKIMICVLLAAYFGSYSTYFIVVQMVKVFEAVMILSLFMFFVMNLIPSMAFTVGKTSINEPINTIFWLGYFKQYDYLKYNLIRNQGVFWEPGAMGFFVVFFLILKIYIVKCRNRMYLYAITVCSTLSAGAIPLLFLVLGNFYYMEVFRDRLISRSRVAVDAILLLLSVLLGLLVMLGASNPDILLSILGAIFKRDFSTDSSTSVRAMDLVYGFRAALISPVFGHGNDYTDYYALTSSELNVSKDAYDGGITNSIIQLFYKYGALFAIYYICLLYRFVRKLSKKSCVFLTIIFTLMLMHEPLHFSLIVLYFLLLPNGMVNINPTNKYIAHFPARGHY